MVIFFFRRITVIKSFFSKWNLQEISLNFLIMHSAQCCITGNKTWNNSQQCWAYFNFPLQLFTHHCQVTWIICTVPKQNRKDECSQLLICAQTFHRKWNILLSECAIMLTILYLPHEFRNIASVLMNITYMKQGKAFSLRILYYQLQEFLVGILTSNLWLDVSELINLLCIPCCKINDKIKNMWFGKMEL